MVVGTSAGENLAGTTAAETFGGGAGADTITSLTGGAVDVIYCGFG